MTEVDIPSPNKLLRLMEECIDGESKLPSS